MLRFYTVSNARDTATICITRNLGTLVQYKDSDVATPVSRQQMAKYFIYWRRCGWKIQRVGM